MPVSNPNSSVTYDGTGSQTGFPTTFAFFTSADIEVIERVIATGVETTKALTTDYTVSGGSGSTGDVTAVTAPPSTVTWTIRRVLAETQETALPVAGALPSTAISQALDRGVMMVQQHSDELARTLVFPKTDDSTISPEIPSSVERASQFLAFDASGAPIAAAGTTGTSTSPVSAFMDTVLVAADAATARTTLGAASLDVVQISALINPSGAINQRGYVSAAATSGANQFTVDRWFVTTSGQSLSWTGSGAETIFTAPAGGVSQVIEGALLETATYAISFVGTATCEVDGVAKVSGDTVALTAGTNAIVKFSSGTFSKPQLTKGASPAPFIHRSPQAELSLCQRYFVRVNDGYMMNSTQTTVTNSIVPLPVPMRAAPTLTLLSTTLDTVENGSAKTGATNAIADSVITTTGIWLQISGWTGLTAGLPGMTRSVGWLDCNAEITS